MFCKLGAPVLATEDGEVQFDTNTLGGNVARLVRPDGSYWYYAHLSAWNLALKTGQQVSAGTVLGYCGNSGDAMGGPTHIHFGEYSADGVAIDPMTALIGWLHTAEARQRAMQLTTTLPLPVGTPPSSIPVLPNITGEAPVSIGLPTVLLAQTRPNLVERSAMMGSAIMPLGWGVLAVVRRRRRRP